MGRSPEPTCGDSARAGGRSSLSHGVCSLAAMSAPGPPGLGRGVIVNVGDPVPAPWAAAPVVTVDRAVLDALDAAPDQRSDVVDALHEHWARRRPVVVTLGVDPAEFRAPRSVWSDLSRDDPSVLSPALDLPHDRLHFLVWANTYDARGGGEPIWWWGRKALKAGAAALDGDADGDVVLPDGTPAWVDGGPRGDDVVALAGGAAVVPSEAVEAGHVRPVPSLAGSAAELAADQLAAVAHGSGPARVIAPAGSGKTRVLTERLRHLVVDRGYEPATVVAVAYNRKARDEMAEPHRGRGRAHPHAQRPRLRHRRRGAGAPARGGRGAGGPAPARTARPHRRPPAQHRPVGALRRGPHHGPPGLAGPHRGRGRAGRRPRAGRGVPPLPGRAGTSWRRRLRRAGAARRRAAAARRCVPPGSAGAAPAPAGRRVPGPDPGPRAAGAAAGGARVRRVRRGRRRPDHLRPRRRRRRGSSSTSRTYFPGADEHALEVNYRCPPPVVDAARHPADPQPGAGAEDDPGGPGRRVRRRPMPSSCGATSRRPGRPSWSTSCAAG